jgi:hypothetical protein
MRAMESASTNDRYIIDARICQVYVVEYVSICPILFGMIFFF